MHADQHEVGLDTVRRLISAQFPGWSGLAVRPVVGEGTVNAIFRVGDELAARFPLRGAGVETVRARLDAEASALAEFDEAVSFPASRCVAIGGPGEGYPLPWSVRTWIPGEVATPTGLAGSAEFAADIATLIAALRAQPTRGRHFTGTGRGGDLNDHSPWVERCLHESERLLDVRPLRTLWERFVELPPAGPDVMSHGDLIPFNLVVRHGRMAGVLDADGYAAADPALDLVAAWHHFDTPARGVIREILAVDDLEWTRGAAWAFEQAIGLVWYYADSNPSMADLGRTTLARIVGVQELRR